MKLHLAVTAVATTLWLSGCDVIVSNKSQLETQYLEQHQELQTVISEIRAKGLDAVAKTAEQGTLAACVANKLDADPMGALIEVEGALQDSANLSELVANIADLSNQEISLEQLPNLLRQGADTVSYLRTLLAQYDLAELKAQAAALLADTQNKSADIGSHLRQIIDTCKTQ
ncbi:hypothetical protein ACFOEE_14580 [Pseudoalteromonas fenneropenaei]|uniref:Lipoprotein n=1 Tax=Pseudoalteromonas fenneropenaei TaxID=1737459 RepID=A0ABV7CM51_9GAMM